MFRISASPALLGLTFLGVTGFALPAHALDCNDPKAKADQVLTAMCSNPDLAKADQEMNDAYTALFRSRDKQQQQALKAMQRDWIDNGRSDGCITDKDIDVACLIANHRRRVDFFKSADGIGPTSQGRLVFKGYYVPHKKRKDVSVAISVLEFEKPDTSGKKTFNVAVEKFVASGKEAGDPLEDACSLADCEATTIMHQPVQLKGFISAPVETRVPAAGHGLASLSYVNQFVDDSSELQFADLFEEYDASVLAKACYDQIDHTLPNATTGDDESNYRPSNTFMRNFRDPSNWKFDGTSIEVNFGSYVLGSYVDGWQSCTLSYGQMQDHLSGGRPLPVAVK